MHDGTMMILNGSEVLSLLSEQENEIIEVVRRAYEAQAEGKSSLPLENLTLRQKNNRHE